ncbi:membrane protein [Bacteroidia bacterium]|nr:membrane protein [Bacteroidia bacterium]GHT82055.1 membrane protein [Bacteroidia bacterium]
MKKYIFIALIGIGASGVLSAQNFKFGHINGQEVIALMPERDSAEAKFTAYAKDLSEQVETMQVEYNNKLNNYQKSAKTWGDAIREQKEKELQDLGQRIQEFQVAAQQDLQKQQADLLRPVIEKANAAIKKVAAEGGFTYIFDVSNTAVSYWNPEQSTDIMPLVRKELNITKELPKK